MSKILAEIYHKFTVNFIVIISLRKEGQCPQKRAKSYDKRDNSHEHSLQYLTAPDIEPSSLGLTEAGVEMARRNTRRAWFDLLPCFLF